MNYLRDTYIRFKASTRLQYILLILVTGAYVLAWISTDLYERNVVARTVTVDNNDLRNAFQAALDSLRVQYDLPGATAAYEWTDGRSGVAVTGFADVEARSPMTSQSRMLAASIGKTFVGAAAVSLAGEGVLDLDIPVERWLGDSSWFQRLPNHKDITLRHLLTHRSGLPNHVYMEQFTSSVSRQWRDEDFPLLPDSLIQFVLDKPALFDAGEGWAYTDTGYILVGMIIEQATGRDYYDIIEDRFMVPLNLKLTNPSNTRILPGLAAGYTAENVFGFPLKSTTSEGSMVWHPGIEWTGGGLVSTSEDLAHWGAELFGGRTLTETALETLLSSDPIDSAYADIHYGMGIAIYKNSPTGKVYGHGGWIPGYSSSLRYYEDHGVAVAFQINTDIGIVEDTSSVVQNMESRLAEVVLSSY